VKINLQNNTHNITSTTHPNLSFYLRETDRICNFLANCCDYTRKQYKAPISFSPEVYETSSKTGSRIRILYLLWWFFIVMKNLQTLLRTDFRTWKSCCETLCKLQLFKI